MSNALKFTPDNGTVVVRICFVPSFTVAPDDGNNSVGHDAAAAAAAPVSVSRRRSVVSFMGSMLDTARGSAGRASVRHGATPRLSTRRRAQNVGESHASASSGAALPAGTVRGTLHIHVTDSGAGISEENQKKLFNEIVQFNPEKLQGGGGSGFGLFICKGIVDLHNRQLRVISDGEVRALVMLPPLGLLSFTPLSSPCAGHRQHVCAGAADAPSPTRGTPTAQA